MAQSTVAGRTPKIPKMEESVKSPPKGENTQLPSMKDIQPHLSQIGEIPKSETDKEGLMMEFVEKLSHTEGLGVAMCKTIVGSLLTGVATLVGGLVGGRYGALLGEFSRLCSLVFENC